MFGFYKTNNLFVGEMRVIDPSRYRNYSTGDFFILKKIGKYKFKEIFTNTEYNDYEPYKNEIVVGTAIPITGMCTETELMTGLISKKRLIEIYNIFNKKETKEDYYATYEENEIKKLMKKYE